MAAKKKVSIEENLERLDTIIEQLEQEDTTLTQSMKAYSEGVGLLRECEQMLDQVEKQMIELVKESENEETD